MKKSKRMVRKKDDFFNKDYGSYRKLTSIIKEFAWKLFCWILLCNLTPQTKNINNTIFGKRLNI